ncbi:hypothetical protein ACH427_04380 [Streptomyces sp. NPDC020379]|uniref:hypothetical protein n=1 Tax=Streptomyces sp. NPDC020379 TaxID=3365071 RepID=UPI0037B3AF55
MRRISVNPGQRLVYRTWTQEMSEPYRRCENTVVVRIGGLRALAFGKWGAPLADEDAAMATVFRLGQLVLEGDDD